MKAHYIIQGNKTTSMPENMARLKFTMRNGTIPFLKLTSSGEHIVNKQVNHKHKGMLQQGATGLDE